MYLSKVDKERLDPLLEKVILVTPQELGYGYIKLTLNHLDLVSDKLSDSQLSNIVGVMERAKSEFIERVVRVNDLHVRRVTADSFHDFIRRRNI
jgi:hypothetical protein